MNSEKSEQEVIFAKRINSPKQVRHTIRLQGFAMEKGKISFSLLSKLSSQLIRISEGTLRLYIEGNSLLKRGQMPEWLKNSVEFTFSGIQKGSTVLKIEAPLLSDTLRNIQYPLFNELGHEDYSNDTALSLSMLAYEKAISEDKETDLLDKYLLKQMLAFKDIVSNENVKIEMNCEANNRKVILTRKSFAKIMSLEDVTPSPVKIKLSGKLDVMKHTSSLLEIVADNKRVKVKLPEKLPIEQLKPFFGTQVTIIGTANYNPARQLVSILLSDIQGLAEGDGFFQHIPSVVKETTDLKELIATQKYSGFKKSKFDQVIDELNIDEPIDTLLQALS